MLDALRTYISMVGIEFVDEGHFMEYVYQRFKPPLDEHDEALGDVLCRLSQLVRSTADSPLVSSRMPRHSTPPTACVWVRAGLGCGRPRHVQVDCSKR
jgi:hypothetical protein